ncbi:MAG: hypothetical protein ACPMAQ_02430 [Phycisphaerae bacterium]
MIAQAMCAVQTSTCFRTHPPATAATDAGPANRPRVGPRAVLLGLIAAVPYLAVAGSMRCDYPQTLAAYHIFAADALLHGQLHLRDAVLGPHFAREEQRARETAERIQRSRGEQWPAEKLESYLRTSIFHDLAIHDGKFYAYWAPLTPVVMMPWVAAFGPGVSDRLINALLGAVNVALAYWMFRNVDRSGLRRLSEACCVALTVLFAFGTVHFWLSCGGCVWFSVQITTLTPLLLSIIALTGRRNTPAMYALSGALFGASVLGRNTVLLLGAFFLIVIWIRRRGEGDRAARRVAVRVMAFGLPVIAAGLVQMAYNYGRFGDAFESGLAIQMRTGGEPRFRPNLDRYGLFNPVYLTRNLYYYFWNWHFPTRQGQTTFDPWGNSMFLVTPPLLYLFMVWRRRDAFTLALLCGVIPLLAALLLCCATGYVQFGNRYLLDGMPLLLLLVATGMNGRVSLIGGVLIIAAVAMNTFGTLRFFPLQTAPAARWLTLPRLTVGTLVLILTWAAIWSWSLRAHKRAEWI